MWRCLHLPWHKLRIEKKLSGDSDKIACSCGRRYAMNHSVRAFLPWDRDFENFYCEEAA